MNSIGQFLTRKKIIIAGGILFILLVIVYLFFILKKQKTNQTNPILPPGMPTTFPTNTSANPNRSFQIIKTSPGNNETDVYAGEITISFTTNAEIASANEYGINITPPLPDYWKITNSYPTKKITAQVYGGLNTNTTYTVTVTDASGKKLYSWSFTSSNNPGQSSSGLVTDYEKTYYQKYYPLMDYIPYSTTDFKVGYQSELTLKVLIKNLDIAKVKQEVIDWIKSHGVDPATHTINYINQF